jgi:hypothetical protein
MVEVMGTETEATTKIGGRAVIITGVIIMIEVVVTVETVTITVTVGIIAAKIATHPCCSQHFPTQKNDEHSSHT